MSAIQPYRQSAMVRQETNSGPRFGLLRAPKPIPPHTCKLPSFFYTKPILRGSLFRCECGIVFELGVNFFDDRDHWKIVAESFWKYGDDVYGLKPKHRCQVPGRWQRMWLLLTFRPIHANSLYRCPECYKVQYYLAKGKWQEYSTEENKELKQWKELGGSE